MLSEVRIHFLAGFDGESSGPFPAQNSFPAVRFLLQQLETGSENVHFARNIQAAPKSVNTAFIFFLNH
jgi:hypothetical protein